VKAKTAEWVEAVLRLPRPLRFRPESEAIQLRHLWSMPKQRLEQELGRRRS
jgi:hypothetical protein